MKKRKRNQADSASDTITAARINSCLKPGKKQKRDKNTGGGGRGGGGEGGGSLCLVAEKGQ